MNDSTIRVENLSKQYTIGHQNQANDTLRDTIASIFKRKYRKDTNIEEFWALKDVSFEIKQGDRVGIIGRNGAGKSTLLKILSQITEPTLGKISIQGRVASLLEVGTGFHPELTGRENVYLNGAILGMSKVEIQQKFDEIVAFSEVEKFLDTPVKRYSSGMYVRLAFAVAAHLEPEILIVDEVLAVGDASFQKKCLGKMEDVGREGRTVIFVSHSIGAVLSLCSRAILLQSGQLLFDGNVKTAISHYMRLGAKIQSATFFSIEEGDRYTYLKNIEIVDTDGKQSKTLSTGIPFGIKVNFSILEQGKNARPSFLICTEDGFKIFQSTNIVGDYTIPNDYFSIAWLDPNILNDGRYILTVALTTLNPIENHVSIEIPIEILENSNDGTRGDYVGEMHGCLRPKISWTK
jgi:lipopolysaccharide transport system ATP-binding protein